MAGKSIREELRELEAEFTKDWPEKTDSYLDRFIQIQADRSRLFDEVKELRAQAFLLADALSNISATGWANGCSNCEECAVCGFGTKYPKDEAKEAYNTWKAYLEKHNGA